MSETPLISVIVPVYKVEPYLHKCVDSILAQTYTNLEIILVDDGSPDGCPAICDEYAAKDSRIRVIHKENGGLSSARNAGLDICTGEYIGFVDSDDWIEPDMYEVLLSGIQATDADISIVSFCDDFNQSGDEKNRQSDWRIFSPVDARVEALLDRLFGCYAVLKLVKRKLFQEVRFPEDVFFCEDMVETSRLLLCCNYVAYCNHPCYHYFKNPNSLSHSFNENCWSILIGLDELWDHTHLVSPENVVYADFLYLYHGIILASRYAEAGLLTGEKYKELRGKVKLHLTDKAKALYFNRLTRGSKVLFYAFWAGRVYMILTMKILTNRTVIHLLSRCKGK